MRLLLEPDDLAIGIEMEDAHLRRVFRADRLRRDGDVGARLDVRLDQIAEVHAVEMVTGKNQVVVGIVAGEVAGGLADGIRRPLEPVGALRRLFRGKHLHESFREDVETVGLRDMPVE